MYSSNVLKERTMIKCSRCGVCCYHIKEIIDYYNIDFPYNYDKNGVCSMLQNNECSCYKNRPDICNANVMYEKIFKHAGISENDYIETNKHACNMLILKHKLNPKYFIK
jgi:Fe-S-cluster containining protein